MPGLAQSLIERRVPQIVAVYVGASWALVQFVAFNVDEFLLSPHWTRVAMVTFLTLLPSVLMLAWFHGGPGRQDVPRSEKIGIGANLVLCASVLWVLFGGKDLGAATVAVTVKNEEGETVEREIPKSEFRKRTAIFPFDVGPGVGEDDAWTSFTVPLALEIDLGSDDFFEAIRAEDFDEPLKALGFPDLLGVPLALKREVSEEVHAQFIMAGEIERTADQYRVTLSLYEVGNGSLVDETVHEGPDLLALVDELSLDTKRALRIPERDGIEDLPVRERLTANDAALEEFGRAYTEIIVEVDLETTLGHLEAATTHDPTFTLAQYVFAQLLLFDNRPDEAVAHMQAALDHVYRLPERFRFPLRSDYYRATGQTDEAWRVLEMWVELYPEDRYALRSYLVPLRMRGDWAGVLETLGTMFRLNPGDADLLIEMADAHLQLGNDDAAIAVLSDYMEQFPDDYSGMVSLAGIYWRRGEYDEAREHLERVIFLEPRLPFIVAELASLNLDAGRFDEAREGYERAMELARTPAQQTEVLAGLKRYYSVRGEADNTVAAAEQWAESAAGHATPVSIMQIRFDDIPIYFSIGRDEEAVALFEELRARAEPPLSDYVVPHLAIHVSLEVEGPEAALETHARAVEMAETGQFGFVLPSLMQDLGSIQERAGDFEAALESYGEAFAMQPARGLHLDAGRVLRKLGHLGEAESELREALRLYPGDPHSHFEMALVLEAREDIEGAVGHLRRSLEAWETADVDFEPARKAREKLGDLER